MTVIKQFMRYTSLNILAMLGISCYVLADTFFISIAQGADGLTALNLVLPIYSVIFAIGNMLGTGSATRFSILRARNDKTADRYFSNAVMFAVIFGLIFTLCGIFFTKDIMLLMGADEHITLVGESYTRIFMTLAPCFMLNYVFNAFVRNDGAPSISMAATLTSSFANVLLDYIFMFPMNMGMAGAALATGLSPMISVGVCLFHFLGKKCTVKFRPCLPSPGLLFQSCRLGISAFVGEISAGVTTTAFNFIVLGIAGNIGVAAYGVVANFAIVANSIFNGISQGQQPLVSRFYGEGNCKNTVKVLKLAVAAALSAAVIILIAVVLFAEQFSALFNSENSVQLSEYAVSGMRLYFIGYIFAGVNIVGTGYLSASDKPAPAFAASVSRGIFAIVGFAFLLSSLFGLTGVWLSFAAAELFTSIITIASLIYCNKKMGAT